MKKFFVFGMVGAIALTFAACSQSNEVNPVQAGLDGESVHTQFAISFPKTKKATRMTAEALPLRSCSGCCYQHS